MMTRKSYPSDVSDDEWAFVAPYLTLMREDAPQREHSLREVFNALRYIIHTGMQWRMMPNDLPPWYIVYQQTQRWLQAGVFEDMVWDLRMLLREIVERAPQPRLPALSLEQRCRLGFARRRLVAEATSRRPNSASVAAWARAARRGSASRRALSPPAGSKRASSCWSGHCRAARVKRWMKNRAS